MKVLLTALAKAKREFDPVLKDRANDFFNSKYATLGAVLKAIGPALDDNGLTVIQHTDVNGNNDICLITTLHHIESGESLVSTWPLHPVKKDPQGEGSACTYARRYSLMTMFGLNAEDDDGNAAAANRPSKNWASELAKTTTSADAKAVGNACWEDGFLDDDMKSRVGAKVAELEAKDSASKGEAVAAEPTVEGVAAQLGAEVTP